MLPVAPALFSDGPYREIADKCNVLGPATQKSGSQQRPAASADEPERSGSGEQACDFRDSRSDLSDAGFAVLGISPDSPAKLAKFRDKEGLTFPLLSDPGREVLEAYGAYGEKMMYGKTTVGVIRSTFVVGPDGKIEHAYYGVKATGHVARLRKDLGV